MLDTGLSEAVEGSGEEEKHANITDIIQKE
jgi:hypothetical protein